MNNLRLERHRIVSLSYNYAPDCIPNKQWGEYCVRISTASHVPELHSHLSSFDIDYFQDEIHHWSVVLWEIFGKNSLRSFLIVQLLAVKEGGDNRRLANARVPNDENLVYVHYFIINF